MIRFSVSSSSWSYSKPATRYSSHSLPTTSNTRWRFWSVRSIHMDLFKYTTSFRFDFIIYVRVTIFGPHVDRYDFMASFDLLFASISFFWRAFAFRKSSNIVRSRINTRKWHSRMFYGTPFEFFFYFPFETRILFVLSRLIGRFLHCFCTCLPFAHTNFKGSTFISMPE